MAKNSLFMIHDCKLSQFVHPNVAALYYVGNFWQIIAGTLITQIQNAPSPLKDIPLCLTSNLIVGEKDIKCEILRSVLREMQF